MGFSESPYKIPGKPNTSLEFSQNREFRFPTSPLGRAGAVYLTTCVEILLIYDVHRSRVGVAKEPELLRWDDMTSSPGTCRVQEP